MSFEDLITLFQDKAGQADGFGGKIRLDVESEGSILIDGSGDDVIISASDEEADTTIGLTMETLGGLMDGSLNPAMAFMGGKLSVGGNMGLAMKLQGMMGGMTNAVSYFWLSPALLLSVAQAQMPQTSELDTDELGFEVGFSLLGLQIAPKYDLSSLAPGLHVRAPLTFGSLSYSETDDNGTTIKGDFDTGSFSVLADYYPFWRGWFRLSGGLISGGYDLTTTTDQITDDSGNTVNADFSVKLAEKIRLRLYSP